ncbi:MAG: hypothetical protein ACYDDI_17595 [Candidatus Acidiferrales bacterium]
MTVIRIPARRHAFITKGRPARIWPQLVRRPNDVPDILAERAAMV